MTRTLFDITEDGQGREQYTPAPADAPPPGIDEDGHPEIIEDDWEAPPQGFVLRPYQHEAVARIVDELYGRPAKGEEYGIDPHRSTLLVLATGLGKTVVAAEVIRRRKSGKVLMIAHRAELIYQAKTTLESLCGEPVTVEMADRYARMDHNIVVATVQTLISGMGGDGRMIAFPPEDVGLIILDEAHHSVSASWLKVRDYFCQNPALKICGLTATPDRLDEAALGKVFESVAMTYEIADAIRDGWLVRITAVPIHVAGLDYSSIRTTAGDLNGADLARVMEVEAPLHEMVQAIVEVVCQAPVGTLNAALAHETDEQFAAEMTAFADKYRVRKSLIFAASVAHAERLCEILNRWLPGRACWVCGKTPKDERAQLFADYKAGRYYFLVNVMVCGEGYDEPTVEVVIIASPTKSRAKYSQMIGRGTRALAGVVDGPETPDARKAAIAASGKDHLEIVDFVGVCGRHTLITPADILGGNYDDDVVERAAKLVQKQDRKAVDIDAALEEAKKQVEAEKARQATRRAKVRVGGKYVAGAALDPFRLFGLSPYRQRDWEKGKPVSDKMRKMLERQKLWHDDIDYSTARQICQGLAKRWKDGLCTYRQANTLSKAGLPINVSFEQAHKWIDKLAANHWQVSADMRAEVQQLTT